jgi:NAD(P) transhydrogenase subunit alpha
MNDWLSPVLFIIAATVGYRLISDVPSLLHTPLMSGMNALSGVTISGALITTAFAIGTGSRLLGAVAIVLATINVVGGFLVTDRMLKMFKRTDYKKKSPCH